MPLKFALNISTVFDEKVPFLERFEHAKNLGFKFVEAQDVYDYTLEEIKEKKPVDLQQILINSPAAGSCGLASIPGEEMQFCQSISKSLMYAVGLDCKLIHILAGTKTEKFSDEDLDMYYVSNLQSVAESLEDNDIIGLIEPICPAVKDAYFLNSFDKAVELLEKIGSTNIKLLLDVYHLFQITGDVSSLKKYLPYAGHVQISQDPGRREPFFPGNIDYAHVLETLEGSGYNGFVGLEFFPSGPLEESVEFIKKYI